MKLPYSLRTCFASAIRSIPMNVKEGPNQGVRWSLATAGRGVLQGTFEEQRVEALENLVRPGEHAWDLGAHKGYMSLTLSRLVGPNGTVSAVEPSKRNHWYLRRHLAWNKVSNVKIVEAAAGGGEGTVQFGGKGSSVGFRIGEGDETVRMTTLQALRDQDGLPQPTVIKMDIEGAEAAAIEAAGDVLSPETLLMVSIHDREQAHRCAELLEGRGFRLFWSADIAQLLDHPKWPWIGDPELLAFGAQREIPDSIERLPLLAESTITA